jgi:hypothetical protein
MIDKDPRYQWLEKRIVASLSPKRDALLNLIENEDNKSENFPQIRYF